MSPPPTPATPEPKRYEVAVEVELISDRLVNVASPVAVVGRYVGLPLQGSAAEVDACLHNWLKRAYESGMIGAASRRADLLSSRKVKSTADGPG